MNIDRCDAILDDARLRLSINPPADRRAFVTQLRERLVAGRNELAGVLVRCSELRAGPAGSYADDIEVPSFQPRRKKNPAGWAAQRG
jgi:hypothetical protein